MFTTTQTSTNTSIRPEIRFELDYLKSINGMLKVALLVLGIINLIAISVAPFHTSARGLFNSTLGIGWSYTLTMLLLFSFHVPEKFYTLPWLPVEIGVTSLVTLLYFIASLLAILQSGAAYTVAAIFGFITMGVYGYSGFLKFNAWKNGELAQGSLTRSTTTTTSQSSAFPA